MSNEIIISGNSSTATTTIVFGRQLLADTLNIITQTENDTVVITPRYNKTGLTELKVCLFCSLFDDMYSAIKIQCVHRWACYYLLVRKMII
jgi:hypothetical protein